MKAVLSHATDCLKAVLLAFLAVLSVQVGWLVDAERQFVESETALREAELRRAQAEQQILDAQLTLQAAPLAPSDPTFRGLRTLR